MKRHVFKGGQTSSICPDCGVRRKWVRDGDYAGVWYYLRPHCGAWSLRRPECTCEIPRDVESGVRA